MYRQFALGLREVRRNRLRATTLLCQAAFRERDDGHSLKW